MQSRSTIRAIAVLLGAAVVVGVIFALVVTWRVPDGDATGGVTRLGWLMPAVVAALVGILGWITLAQDRIDRDEPHAMVMCVSCGSNVMRGWRMCPYCGHLVEEGEFNE